MGLRTHVEQIDDAFVEQKLKYESIPTG